MREAMKEPKTIDECIKAHRLSNTIVAQYMSRSPSLVSKWRNRRRKPTESQISKLLELFGLENVTDLIT